MRDLGMSQHNRSYYDAGSAHQIKVGLLYKEFLSISWK